MNVFTFALGHKMLLSRLGPSKHSTSQLWSLSRRQLVGQINTSWRVAAISERGKCLLMLVGDEDSPDVLCSHWNGSERWRQSVTGGFRLGLASSGDVEYVCVFQDRNRVVILSEEDGQVVDTLAGVEAFWSLGDGTIFTTGRRSFQRRVLLGGQTIWRKEAYPMRVAGVSPSSVAYSGSRSVVCDSLLDGTRQWESVSMAPYDLAGIRWNAERGSWTALLSCTQPGVSMQVATLLANGEVSSRRDIGVDVGAFLLGSGETILTLDGRLLDSVSGGEIWRLPEVPRQSELPEFI